MTAPEILVVDDTISNLKLLELALSADGYRVRTAGDGRGGLEAALKNPPDLVLLDIAMPDLDGFAVCRALKEDDRTSAIPVIFLTARSDDDTKVRAFEAGGVDYITKPFQLKEVSARVANHLALRDTTRQLEAANEQLRLQNRRLEEAQQMAEQLTQLIIHDLRMPLSGLIGYLELIELESDPAERQETVRCALEVADRMDHIVRSLLDVSRLEESLLPVHAAACDLCGLARQVIEAGTLSGEAARCVLDVPQSAVVAHCDRSLTYRLLTHLLHAALRLSPRDSKVTFTVRAAQDHAIVLIDDSGPGIPEAVRDAVFERFGALKLAQSIESPQTVGFGLRFCKLAIEAQDGSVVIEDSDRGGSRVRLQLPLEPA